MIEEDLAKEMQGFVDVRFSLEERADHQWDLLIYDKSGGKITGIGPLSWDDAVRECNRCQRIRTDFLSEIKGVSND